MTIDRIFLKAKHDFIKCFVLFPTQRCSVHCHKEIKKPENIHILEAGIREFLLYFRDCLTYNYLLLMANTD